MKMSLLHLALLHILKKKSSARAHHHLLWSKMHIAFQTIMFKIMCASKSQQLRISSTFGLEKLEE